MLGRLSTGSRIRSEKNRSLFLANIVSLFLAISIFPSVLRSRFSPVCTFVKAESMVSFLSAQWVESASMQVRGHSQT